MAETNTYALYKFDEHTQWCVNHYVYTINVEKYIPFFAS